MDSQSPKFTTGFALNSGMSLYPELWRGLVGIWSPEIGKQGDKLYDFSGYGHHATLTNFGTTDPYYPGKFGHAVRYDGTNDFADAGNIPQIDDASQNLSLLFWMRSSATASQTLITYDNNSVLQPATDWYCYCATGGNLRIGGFGSTGELDTGITSASLRDGKFHHIAIILKQTTIEVYIDGVLRYNPANTKTHGNFGGTFSLQFGAGENVAFYNGDFGEIRLYNRDLQAREILQSYFGASPLTALFNYGVPSAIVDETETLSILDSIQVIDTTVMEEDTISVIDSINIQDTTQYLSDTLAVTDSIIVTNSNTNAELGVKILSVNPLIFVTGSSPAEIVKVDTSIPETLTWEVRTITGINQAYDATIKSIFDPSQSTAVTNPGLGANNTDIGTIAWSSPNNILSSDDIRASVTLAGTATTNFLYASNFGFSLPSNAEILGITATIERLRSGGTTGEARDTIVKLVKNGTVIGNNKALTTTNYPTTDASVTYGSISDIWGANWIFSDINDTDFGLVLACIGSTASTNRLAEVDRITLTITYREAVSRHIYVASEIGQVVKIAFDDLTDQTIIDLVDTDELISIDSNDDLGLVYVGSENIIGELYILDDRTEVLLDSDIQVLQPVEVFLESDFNLIHAEILDTDIQVLGLSETILNTDFKCLTDLVDNITPIKQPDFVVFVDNVQLTDIDIDLASITITHSIDNKSNCTFNLSRRHDRINYDLNGNLRTINAQNTVRIEIDGHIEFEGKISNLNCQYTNVDNIVVTAEMTQPQEQYNNILLSLPGLNTRLGLYEVLINNPQIYNPFLDDTEENPIRYKGIKVGFGEKIKQSVSRFTTMDTNVGSGDNIGKYAKQLTEGTFNFKQNWTYFWGCSVFKPEYFTIFGGAGLTNSSNLGKPIPNAPANTPFHAIELPVFYIKETELPNTEATGDSTLINFNYIGTSLSPVSSDIWVLHRANYRHQRIRPNIVTRAGTTGIITEGEIKALKLNIVASTMFSDLQGAGYIDSNGIIQDSFIKFIFDSEDLDIGYSLSIKSAIYQLLDSSVGYYVGEAPFKTISTRNGQLITKPRLVDEPNGLYLVEDAGYDYRNYAKQIADLEYEKIKNINGQIFPETSCALTLTIDGYYYHGIKLLTRINLDNTTESGIFKNNNGFPLGVKSITINSGSMTVQLQTDNLKSTPELEEIDGLFPDEESDEFTYEEDRLLIDLKSDMKTRLKVE